MAVGDVIADNGLGGASFVTFQPAAGVEIIITAFLGNGATIMVGVTDGIAARSVTGVGLDGTYANVAVNCKIGITNTHYLSMYATSESGYSGIQIK